MKLPFNMRNDEESERCLDIQNDIFGSAEVRKRFMEIRDKLNHEDKSDFAKIMIYCYLTGESHGRSE